MVPSANYVQIFADKGLTVPLDLSKLPNHAKIAPEWRECDLGPGPRQLDPVAVGHGGAWRWIPRSIRATSTPARSAGSAYELKGKINVVPEMMDILTLATMY